MENIVFSFYQDKKIQQITCRDLLRNKRVLVCSITRPFDRIATQYSEYLATKLAFYANSGIDAVYFVNSTHGLYYLSVYPIRVDGSKIDLLVDPSKTWVAYAKQLFSKSQDVDFLSKFWNYQVLFNNGEIEHFTESSLDDPLREATKFINPKEIKWVAKEYITEDPKLVVWRPSLLMTSQKQIPVFQAIYYQNVWPNPKLDKYLVDTNTAIK